MEELRRTRVMCEVCGGAGIETSDCCHCGESMRISPHDTHEPLAMTRRCESCNGYGWVAGLPVEPATEATADPRQWWMPLMSGRRVNFADLQPDQIHIADIALGLSNQSRYAGQSTIVTAEHCVVMTAALAAMGHDPATQIGALMHDAEEAYLQDLPRPVKRHPAMAWYRQKSDDLRAMIWQRFNLPMLGPKLYAPIVGHADDQILWLEARSIGFPLHPDCQSPEDVTFGWPKETREHVWGHLSHQYWEMQFIREWVRLTRVIGNGCGGRASGRAGKAIGSR